MEPTINVLLSSFHGLSLPSILAIPLPSTSTLYDLTKSIPTYLPANVVATNRLILSTISNNNLSSLNQSTSLRELSEDGPFLRLRLSVPLQGGKGGFGSQLRAAGGRMQSKRRNNRNGQDPNGSNRNLDGRRLRTVTEAKHLAEYLALKPEMEAKEKEERRKRWEAVVEAAERREEEIRNGKGNRGKLDGQWVEDKEEVGERAREAVLKAMKGQWTDGLRDLQNGDSSMSGSGSGSGSSGEEGDVDEESEGVEGVDLESSVRMAEERLREVRGIENGKGKEVEPRQERRYFGFDNEDDEFLSDSDQEDEEEGGVRLPASTEVEVEGKGKGRA